MRKTQSSSTGFSLIELLIVVAVIGIIASIAIPYLFAAKQASKGASAVSSMRLIHTSEVTYKSSNGAYGDLSQLASAGFLNDVNLTSGTKSDYTFTVTPDNASAVQNYTAVADPVDAPSIWRHFYVDATGVIRYRQGAVATSSSSPIGD